MSAAPDFAGEFPAGPVRFVSENISHNFGTRNVDTVFAMLLGVDDGQPVSDF
jgi:hypothetical protein